MDLYTFLIVVSGIFLGFFVQTVIGFAGALIALPILLITIQLPDAIAYISIFYMISSAFLLKQEWKYINKRIILRLLASSTIGVIFGVWILGHGKPHILKKALGIFILGYVVYVFFVKSASFKWSKLEYVFGFLGGFFSGVFSTGGPLYVILVKNVEADIRVFRATMIGVLALVTFIRVPALSIEGILSIQHFYYALWMLPFFLFAQYLGKRTYHKLNEAFLKQGVLLLLLCSGVLLTINS